MINYDLQKENNIIFRHFKLFSVKKTQMKIVFNSKLSLKKIYVA